jgi:hypothetical protein
VAIARPPYSFSEAFIASSAFLSAGRSSFTVPDNLAVNSLIFVPQDVADAGDVPPADIFVLRLEFTAEVPAGFGNHFNTSLQR